ncbi:hypothetical protein BDB01DRAFT_831187 [Pilobolus umbonatus]|nr:hypothetical protein BDB01DRAFT_831187 [Pilobolus umbonatus]
MLKWLLARLIVDIWDTDEFLEGVSFNVCFWFLSEVVDTVWDVNGVSNICGGSGVLCCLINTVELLKCFSSMVFICLLWSNGTKGRKLWKLEDKRKQFKQLEDDVLTSVAIRDMASWTNISQLLIEVISLEGYSGLAVSGNISSLSHSIYEMVVRATVVRERRLAYRRIPGDSITGFNLLEPKQPIVFFVDQGEVSSSCHKAEIFDCPHLFHSGYPGKEKSATYLRGVLCSKLEKFFHWRHLEIAPSEKVGQCHIHWYFGNDREDISMSLVLLDTEPGYEWIGNVVCFKKKMNWRTYITSTHGQVQIPLIIWNK